MIARLAFPDAWRLLLIFDLGGEGLHGAGEDSAFRAAAAVHARSSPAVCAASCSCASCPASPTADLDAVGPAIGEIQREVGDHFAPAQNGRFISPAVSAVLAWLEAQGVAGVGQSSWGPTGFAILPDADSAGALCREAERRFGTALREPAVHGHPRPQSGRRVESRPDRPPLGSGRPEVR